MLLAQEPHLEVVAEASNGRKAVDQAARFHPRCARPERFSNRQWSWDEVRDRGNGRGGDDYLSFTAETSNSKVTFSLTSTPPVSSGAFQFTPQSFRLITVEPSKPRRTLPYGSFADPA